MKAEQKQKDSLKENTTAAPATIAEARESKLPSKTSTSSNTELDLDVFLLGDLGSDDDVPGRQLKFSYLLSLFYQKDNKFNQKVYMLALYFLCH